MIKKILFLAIVLLSSNLIQAQTIDASKSKVEFELSNMGFKTVEGTFSGIEGKIAFNTSDLNKASFQVCIQVKTVDTDSKTRDGHLLKEDFFHEEKHPNICFQSTSISKTENGYLAKGSLTMKGVTKEIEIPFTFSSNTFNGTLTLERLDYGVGPKGGFMVGKTVNLKITCVIQ